MKSNYTRKDIIVLPDKRLREKSVKVHIITDETLQIIEDMLAATIDWENSRPHEMAVALAAVQIGELERIVIIRNDLENKEDQTFTVLINPEIIKKEGKVITDQEGCLSVPDVYGLVPRHEKVRVNAINVDGQKIRVKTQNPFIARILQHEVDHCNGQCFVDHIAHDKNAFSILTKSGSLEPIEYNKVVKMGILPED